MKLKRATLLFLFLLCTQLLCAQNILVLEKISNRRNFKFSTGNSVHVQTIKTGLKHQGRITRISDSSLVINYGTEILIRDVSRMYTPRWGYGMLQKLCLISGLSYLIISGSNGALNGDDPIVPSETLYISGGLVAAGILLTPLATRVHDIEGGKWRLKILDFTN